jgi:deaminated glutathione amidase
VVIVAAIQMCSMPEVETNLAAAQALIGQAAAAGAKLVVLPEMFAVFGENTEQKLALAEEQGTGRLQDFLANAASQHGVWLVGGTIPLRTLQPGKARAACLVFNAEGLCVARYDKLHLFDAVISAKESYQESKTTEPGDKLVVVTTPVGKVGLAVCYDIRFPELFTQLANHGAEIFAIPAAFTTTTGQAHWQLLTRARAVENIVYVIGACQGGKHSASRQTYGHSLIISPWGEVLAEQHTTASGAVILQEINIDYVQQVRNALPVHQHRMLNYAGLTTVIM